MNRRIILIVVLFIWLFSLKALPYNNEPAGWAGWLWKTDYQAVKLWLAADESVTHTATIVENCEEIRQSLLMQLPVELMPLNELLKHQSIIALANAFSLSASSPGFVSLITDFYEEIERIGENPLSYLEGLDSAVIVTLKGYGYSQKDVLAIALKSRESNLRLTSIRNALKSLLSSSSNNQGIATQKWHAFVNTFKQAGDTGIGSIFKLDPAETKNLVLAAKKGVFDYNQDLLLSFTPAEWKAYIRVDDQYGYYGFNWDEVSYFFFNGTFAGVRLVRKIDAGEKTSFDRIQQIFGSESALMSSNEGRGIRIWAGSYCSIVYSEVNPNNELLLIGSRDYLINQFTKP